MFYLERDILGLIYKTVNTINGKMYIGKTTRTIQDRITEHKKAYKNVKSRMYNFKIYSAMRKYGFENFKFEVLEKCSDEVLDQQERFYIDKFRTNIDGYNEAIGGSGKALITDKQIEAFKVLYENGWLLQDIADVFKTGAKAIGRKLKSVGIDTYSNANSSFSIPVVGIKKTGEEIKFSSISDAARYILEESNSNAKLVGVISKISNALKNNNCSVYGYKWRYQ